MITFVCWLWHGWRPVYEPKHVNRLAELLAQYVHRPYRLVCITDDHTGINADVFPLWPQRPDESALFEGFPGEPRVKPNCFNRLRIFEEVTARKIAQGSDRIVSIDLDVNIYEDVTDLFTNMPLFKAAKGYRSLICGSMFAFAPGTHDYIWRRFDPVESPKVIAEAKVDTPQGPKKLSGSDQAWMSLCLPPDVPMWGETDGVYQFLELHGRKRKPADARMVFFAGRDKPWTRDVQLLCPELYTPCP